MIKPQQTMQDFKSLETLALIDLLAQYTAQFTNKIASRSDNNNMELEQYQYEIAMIQSELNSRKMTHENASISDPYTQISSIEPSTNSNN